MVAMRSVDLAGRSDSEVRQMEGVASREVGTEDCKQSAPAMVQAVLAAHKVVLMAGSAAFALPRVAPFFAGH